ncbi:MAG: DUF2809 domain-containing protein [Bacillota bacterium]|nr:DUF2809 domain-containing protein [Bacillota bacterium]
MIYNGHKRNRFIYGLAILLVILLGLASRSYAACLPDFLANYAGDTLWGLMIFFGFGWVFKEASTKWIFVGATVFSFCIELSQLYQADWINAIRHTRIGGLILGFSFVWSDLLCYLIGSSIGALIERIHALRPNERI